MAEVYGFDRTAAERIAANGVAAYADYVSPGGPSRDEVLDIRAGAVQAPGTRLNDIGGQRSGK